MTHTLRRTTRRVVVALTALATALPVAAIASPAVADTRPADPALPLTVAADGLPTVQIDGVVWSQAVVGNTVYAGGEFTTARPAGSAAGVNTVPRHNLLAYDITTGNLIDSFNHDLNGQVLSVAKSPDGSRIYVTGDFTQVDGQWRVRVAAFDTATGALLPGFAPTLGTRGLVVTATSSAVYVGGNFTSVASTTGGTLVPRQYLAAFDPTTGAVLPFQADASAAVTALAVTADGSKLVVGGRFTTLSGVNAYGLGGVDPTTGTSLGFAAASEVRNAGAASDITSLVADSTGVYGTGYVYGSGGNLEGTFRADPVTGQLIWVADCHGDTYSVFPAADVVYTVGHQHYCGNIPGGFPQSTPWTYHHISAFTKAATTTNTPDIYGYADHPGKPAPSTLYIWPQFYTGTYTGQGQAGWSVAGNDTYVVMGGEFVGLNGKAQQGLVRFATRDVAPDKQGPRLSGTDFPVKAVSDAPGEVRITWTGNYDRDNATLTYRVYRGTANSQPLTTRTVTAMPWDEPTLGFTDTGRTAGASEQYLVTATDPYGNTASSAWVPVTVAGAGTTSAYETVVRGSEPYAWWRLGESSGPALADTAGFDPAKTLGGGVTFGATGAISGDPDKAATFNGSSSGAVADTVPVNAPDQFSVEAWFSTTSNRGGKIVGFGSSQSGTSSTADRHLYLDNSGRVLFGVQDTGLKTVQSGSGLNNGQWHHVVGTYTKGVMRLYVDGTEVASRSDVTYERSYWGYWRIGGDRLQSWPNSPSSIYLNGKIDDVAVYRRALSAAEVSAHRTAGLTGALPVDLAPTAAILSSSSGATATLDGASSTDRDGQVVAWAWDFGDGATGSGAQVSHKYAETGTYTVTLTVTDDRGATGTTTAQVAVVRPANEPPVAAASATVSGLVATFNGAASLDPDGTIAAYAWDFGDGTTGTGATPQHTYPAAGTYTATLTVTDDRGGTGSTTVAVKVSARLAADAFGRSTTSGWGSADVGGAWTVSTPLSASSVSGGVGKTSVAAGITRTARLTGVSSTDTDARVTFTLDRDQTGGGTTVMLSPRSVSGTEYAARVKVVANGTASLQILAAGTSLASVNLPGTYPANTPITIRVQAVGTSPTTLRAKAWTGATEPGWLVSTTDSLASLQVAGGIGLTTYVSGSATNGPVLASFDDLVAYPSGLVPPPNQPPTASFMAQATDLLAAFDASASSDPEGQPLTYAWAFGDGEVGTGVAPSHTYAAPGTYTVALTVTDDQGATATVSRSVVVTPPNQAPTASATSTATALTATFDGTASADPDGTVASWQWDFGDGETASGPTTSHTYAAAGSYTVTLTVTDDKGATGTTTLTVVATPPVVVLAQDTFTRTSASGWGTAEVGGAWTVDGTASTYQVDGATASQRLTSAGLTRTAMLKGVSSTSTDVTATLSVDKAATGGGVYALLIGRRVGTSDDALKVKFLAGGSVQLQLLAGATTLTTVTMPGTYTPGDVLQARVQVVGTSPTTLRARVWRASDPEPTTWQLQATDATAAMQAAGSVGLLSYLSGSATNAPVAVSFDNLLVTQVP